MKNNNRTLSRGQKIKFPAMALGLSLAMAGTSFGATDFWTGAGTDILWSNSANWDTISDGGSGGALPVIKTVIGENNYGTVGANDVTMDISYTLSNGFEMYGKAVMTIVNGGILTLENGGDRGIYTGPNPAGDIGTLLILDSGGKFIVEGTMDGVPAAVSTPGGSLVTDTTTNPGYTIYSNSAAIPEPTSMSLLALGGLALLRRRRRA